MPTYSLTSQKTGQNYDVDFERDPDDDEVDEVINELDLQFYRDQGLSPNIAAQGSVETAARGFMRIGTNLVQGAIGGGGRILGAMEDAAADVLDVKRPGTYKPVTAIADAIGEEGRQFWATNPANPAAQTLGEGAGQALTLIAGSAAAVPVIGAKAAFAGIPSAIGGVLGGGEGIKTAEEMGIENPAARLALGGAFAGAEALTERLGGIGGGTVKAGLKAAGKSILSEAIEEPISGTLQDAGTAFAGEFVEDPDRPGYTQSGYKLPALDADFLERRKLEAIGGAAGGTVFGALQVAGGLQNQEPRPMPAVSPEAAAADPRSMAAIAARAGSQDVAWMGNPADQDQSAPPEAQAQTIGGRPLLLANLPDGAPTLRGQVQEPSEPALAPLPQVPAARQPILSQVPDAPPPIRLGDSVSYEGYTGTLLSDGARFAVQVPGGPLVEIADASSVTRAQPAPLTPPSPVVPRAPTLPDPQVSEALFRAAADGSMAIQTADGQTFIPHNPQLLRTVRQGPNGLEVLVRKPEEPGRIFKLVGAQARSAQEAFLGAAANVEAAGGKVNWGSSRPRLQFSQNTRSREARQRSLANRATATILSHDSARNSDPDHARSPQRRALETARALLRGAAETSYGFTRARGRGQRDRAERDFLSRRAEAPSDHGRRVGQGGEHIVYSRPDDRVTKVTHPGKFGQVLDQMGPDQGYRFNLRPALASEYLQRIALHNAVFGDDIQILGFEQSPEGLTIITTQPTLNGPNPSKEDVDAFLKAHGFQPLPESLYDTKTINQTKRPWYRESDGVMIVDAKKQNFVLHDGAVYPIDLMIQIMPDDVMTSTRSRRQFSRTQTLNDEFTRGLPSLRKAVQDARQIVHQYIPGLITPKVHIVTSSQELIDSGMIDPSSLSPEETASLQTAEGFYDNLTGNTVIIAANVEMRPGESPRSAIARVLLHERVGHEGVNALIQSDASFAQKWGQLATQIPTASLDAIAAEEGYAHLATDRAQLALEWLARQADEVEGARHAATVEGGLKGIARQMWQALKEFLAKAFQGFSNKAAFSHDIAGLITQAREAALNGTADPTTPAALVQRIQFSLGGSRIRHEKGKPYRVNDRAWRSILTGSALPKAFVETVAATERERRALDQAAAQIGKDLDAAAEAYAEQSGRPIAQVYELLNQVMSGAPGTNAVLLQAAPVLAERARRARNFMDDLSQAIAHTLPTGTLRNSILLNQGAWMKRSYAAFEPASGWNYDAVMAAAKEGREIAGRNARDIVAKAMRFLRAQNPGATRSELEATMRDLMDRDTWAGYLTGKAAVRKNVSSLMERAEIPVEIRDLMGEEHNPIKRFAQSTSFQAQFLHRHQGQTALRTIGLGNGLFKPQRGGVYTIEIPADTPRWSPLAGLWTTPQLWKALQDIEGVTTGTDLGSKALEGLKWLGSEAKFNRVAANPDSWLVNMLGNVVALVQTGDAFYTSFFRRVGEAVALHRAGRPKAADLVNVATEAITDAQRALIARLTASGVIGETMTLRDLEASLPRHLLQWVANDQRPDRILGGVKGALWGQAAFRGLGLPGRAAGAVIGAAAGASQGYARLQEWQQTLANYVMTGPDAIARLTGFLGNYETALSAGMTPEAAFTHASERTRNTFPDYGKLPEIMKTLSRYGVMGSFIGFTHEVFRNTSWNLVYAAQDLRSSNPALVERGLKRTLGAASVGILAAGGLQAIFQGLAGTDDERNKKWRRWFAAPWEKNGVIVFTKYTPEGVSYFNTSYLIPQAIITELWNAIASGRDPGESAAHLTAAIWEQFMGNSVHVGPILSAIMNTDRMGRPLTYKTGLGGLAERADAALAPILEPGWAAKLERIEYALREAERRGRTFSLQEEAKRLVGVREFSRTWPDMVKRAYDALQARNSAIRAQANKTLGLNLPGARQKAIQEANRQIEQLAQDTADFEADLAILGVPANIIKAARRDSSIPRKFAPIEVDPDTLNRVRSLR